MTPSPTHYTVTNVKIDRIQDWTWNLSFTITSGLLTVEALTEVEMAPGFQLDQEKAMLFIHQNADFLLAKACAARGEQPS